MKNQYYIFLLYFVFCNVQLYSQINPREFDENYMYTVFEDNFNGSTINRNSWNAGLIHRGIGQLIDSSLTHNVSNGRLGLTMEYIPNYNDSANFVGGEFSTQNTFLYGIFECQATFANGWGSWPAFWSFHRQPCPNNDGPEIDFAEYFCKVPYVNELGHFIHRWYDSPCGGPGNGGINIYPGTAVKYGFNTSTNLYKCIWTPEKIEFYVDGDLKGVYNREYGEWYPIVPVCVIVSQQILQPYNYLGQPITPYYPQTSYFNYVKVKQFFLSPEITCPEVICTTGVATLDVDSLATNISWELSPVNLFSITNGTGDTANINVSGGSGLSTVTFSFQMPGGEVFTKSDSFWVGTPHDLYGVYCEGGGGGPVGTYPVWTGPFYEDYDSIVWGVSPAATITEVGYGIADIYFGSPGNYTISAYNANECGVSSTEYTYFYVYSMLLSPNPAYDEVEITIDCGETEDLKSASLAKQEYVVTISDMYGITKSQKNYSGNKFTIPVQHLKEGNYIVKLSNDKISLSKQLIIKR